MIVRPEHPAKSSRISLIVAADLVEPSKKIIRSSANCRVCRRAFSIPRSGSSWAIVAIWRSLKRTSTHRIKGEERAGHLALVHAYMRRFFPECHLESLTC